jgi:hypothetical protein
MVGGPVPPGSRDDVVSAPTHPHSESPVPTRPRWFDQVQFTAPRPIPLVKLANDIPDRPGCCVFTASPAPLARGAGLYVGRALSLRRRVGGYFVNYMTTAPTKHKGRAFLFEYRYHRGDDQLFLRWTIYGDPTQLEASLIDHLEPTFNDRDERDPFADDEGLDARYLP